MSQPRVNAILKELSTAGVVDMEIPPFRHPQHQPLAVNINFAEDQCQHVAAQAQLNRRHAVTPVNGRLGELYARRSSRVDSRNHYPGWRRHSRSFAYLTRGFWMSDEDSSCALDALVRVLRRPLRLFGGRELRKPHATSRLRVREPPLHLVEYLIHPLSRHAEEVASFDTGDWVETVETRDSQ